MREIVFLKKNEEKWKKADQELSSNAALSADHLASLFIELTDDLAYAQTNYPDSRITAYLNGLTSDIYLAIYKNKKNKRNGFFAFWKYDLPLEVRKSHRQLLYAFLFFAVSALIGAVSTAYDEEFPRIILGDEYVNMTLDNIEKGDPMAVYKSADSESMFHYITFNNIKVAFITFTMGIFFSVGTVYILFNNGIMLGSFQYFFYQKGLFLTSFLTIWIHGTLEISAIVIAGGAGIVLGNSILFPGTYKRRDSLVRAAKRSLKICLGLVPIFIVAGFLESFVTRHTEMPVLMKCMILILSLMFILFYFVFYPIWVERKVKNSNVLPESLTIQMGDEA